MKQLTIRVEGFATVTVKDDWDGNMINVPVKIDVFDWLERDDSEVQEVLETEVTTKEVMAAVGNI